MLCAHNADFDVGFLTAAAERLGLPFDPTYLDTLIFAQNLMPQLTNHKLDTVAMRSACRISTITVPRTMR